ncbi:MAG: hypothetical protein IT424_00065, partial [Pirellulales bacterium]|nr:hypothetical protein [Pirellulales bacterium]
MSRSSSWRTTLAAVLLASSTAALAHAADSDMLKLNTRSRRPGPSAAEKSVAVKGSAGWNPDR